MTLSWFALIGVAKEAPCDMQYASPVHIAALYGRMCKQPTVSMENGEVQAGRWYTALFPLAECEE